MPRRRRHWELNKFYWGNFLPLLPLSTNSLSRCVTLTFFNSLIRYLLDAIRLSKYGSIKDRIERTNRVREIGFTKKIYQSPTKRLRKKLSSINLPRINASSSATGEYPYRRIIKPKSPNITIIPRSTRNWRALNTPITHYIQIKGIKIRRGM